MIAPTPVTGVLSRAILGNSIQAWLTAALTAAIIFLVLVVVRRVLVSRIGALAARTSTHVDDTILAMIAETRTWVCFAVAVLVAASSLNLWRLGQHVPATLKLIVLWQIALWGAAAIAFWMQHHLSRRTSEQDRTSVAMITAIGVGAKVLLWILVFVTALTSVFSINITPLITSLGVSGIAVALAVQNILGDILAALAIVFDKPFDVGDAIGVDDISGTVERIGLKTTHLRSASVEQIIIGNGDLLKSRLHNYRRQSQRRVVFNLDITYDTPTDVVGQLPKVVEAIVTKQSPVKFDRSHVSSFGESAIRIETVYYVLVADYMKYMNIQQAINLDLLREFASQNVKFAFPGRTVYHQGLVAKDLAVQTQPQSAQG